MVTLCPRLKDVRQVKDPSLLRQSPVPLMETPLKFVRYGEVEVVAGEKVQHATGLAYYLWC